MVMIGLLELIKNKVKKKITDIKPPSNSGVNIVRKDTEKIEEPLEVQVEKMKEEIKELNQKIKEKDEINEQLRKEIDRLKDLLSKK